MKKIEFDAESPKIQEMLTEIAVTSRLGITMASAYKNDVAHMENDIAFMAVVAAHSATMKFIAAILENKETEEVSFEELMKDFKSE